MIRRPPRYTLFPYTTLFRSLPAVAAASRADVPVGHADSVDQLADMLDWIGNATLSQLRNLTDEQRALIEAHQMLKSAYEERLAYLESLLGSSGWSDINWRDSLDHGYGVVKLAKAHISGVVWLDANYNGIHDAGEGTGIANVPVKLTRYWYGKDASGRMTWIADDKYNAKPICLTSSAADGSWIFDELDVAGKRMVDGVETVVLYGYQVTVEDLPKGYGVTVMNQGSDETADSDLDEMTKLLQPADPHGGMIVLAGVSTRPDLAVAGSSVHLAGPGNTAWVVGEGVDCDYNDTGLLPYALASIAGIVFEDPEGDGLKGSTAIGLFGRPVYLDRMVLDVDAEFGFNAPSYVSTALKAITADGVDGAGTWTEVASAMTAVDGSYRFDNLPMVDGQDRPYLYRVRSILPDGTEFVAVNVGNDDNNDSDWWNLLGSQTVGITPGMAVLGAFHAGRTEPNAYGQRFNLLTPYNWTPEVGRAVDLGMKVKDEEKLLGRDPLRPYKLVWDEREGRWKMLPQTGDSMLLLNCMALASLGALLILLLAMRRRKDDEEEE